MKTKFFLLGNAIIGSTLGVLTVWTLYTKRFAELLNTANSRINELATAIPAANHLLNVPSPAKSIAEVISTSNSSPATITSVRTLVEDVMEFVHFGPAENGVVERWYNLATKINQLYEKTRLSLGDEKISSITPSAQYYLAALVGFGLGGLMLAYLFKSQISPAITQFFNKDLVARVQYKRQLLAEVEQIAAEIRGQVLKDLPSPLPGEKYEPDVETPDEYICPILRQIMRFPIKIEGDPHAYERSAITKWYLYNPSTQKLTPLTRAPMSENPINLPVDEELDREIKHYIQGRSKSQPTCTIV